MAGFKLPVPRWFSLMLAMVAVGSQLQGVHAADTGNVLAGLLGMFIGIVAICSFLGWWSRRKSGGENSSTSSQEDTSNI